MSYSTQNPKATYSPQRSVPLFRPVSVLGAGFLQQHAPASYERQLAEHAVRSARSHLANVVASYDHARKMIGECNRGLRRDRHDREITPDYVIRRQRSSWFGAMNRARGAVLQAKRALHTAQVALTRLAG